MSGNAHHICMSTCQLLSECADDVIRWPAEEALPEFAADSNSQIQLVRLLLLLLLMF